MSDSFQNELQFKKSSIKSLLTHFGATEKLIFGILLGVFILATLFMLTSVNNHFMVTVPGKGGELREGLVGLPRTINPILAISDVDRDISSLVYSGLMRYEADSLVPDLALSYKVSDDGLVYSFKLRPDITFSDGQPLTTEDIDFTIKKIQDPNLKSPRRADWSNVTVQKISSSEINFILKQPYAPFITNTALGILPKHIWENISDEQFIFSNYNIQPVGAGPYKVTSISKDSKGIPSSMVLEVWNSRNHQSSPYISSLIFSFYNDNAKALSALENNDIDSLSSVSADEITSAASTTSNWHIISAPLPRIFSVFFNQAEAPIFKDASVRKALDMVTDRSLIVEQVLHGYGEPLFGPLPVGLATTSTASIASATNTIALAQALLEKNGWKKGDNGIYVKKSKSSTDTLAFDLYTAEADDLNQIAILLRNVWTELGAQVNIKTFSSNDLYQNVIRTRKYDALLFGEQIGKDRDLYAFWHSSQRNAPGLNVAMYANSKVDKILEDLRSTNDEDKRKKEYADLAETITNDLPAIFLFSPDFIYVTPQKIKGLNLSSITTPTDRWNTINNWYIKTENIWQIFDSNK